MKNYLELDLESVQGYKNLSEDAKFQFERTYKLHNSIQGSDYKEGYTPTSVTDSIGKLKVTFKNGEWLYYYPNGTWG